MTRANSQDLARWITMLTLSLSCGCDDIKIGSVKSLWLLWIVPVALAFNVYVFRSKTRAMRRFVSIKLLDRLASGVSRPRQYLKAFLIGCQLASERLVSYLTVK